METFPDKLAQLVVLNTISLSLRGTLLTLQPSSCPCLSVFKPTRKQIRKTVDNVVDHV